MPSSAREIVDQLCEFFALSGSAGEREKLAEAVKFQSRFLRSDELDDLASLLFIECELDRPKRVAEVERLLSRVQKRLYREARRTLQMPPFAGRSRTSDDVTPGTVDRVVNEFKRSLSVKDMLILQWHYIDGRPRAEICAELDMSETTLYERLKHIVTAFKRFLDDVGLPGLH